MITEGNLILYSLLYKYTCENRVEKIYINVFFSNKYTTYRLCMTKPMVILYPKYSERNQNYTYTFRESKPDKLAATVKAFLHSCTLLVWSFLQRSSCLKNASA